jgi:hypothetical protein
LSDSFAQLRTEVLRQGTGRNTQLVASALRDLEFLTKLAQANSTSDPSQAAAILARGKQALDAARRNATKAGHDWQL